ncbi:Hypothetical Protein FCC1311_063402 [Hondaea fermentalgiana]|uniref:LamG-like jellyroll fold domain-containing protein n=1 Tax=Hondaea fermentalgiana TaxID=2315210 RepID=A0A2R5GGW6_9STRA|nr:Hypothetical Protein FCC1311_063402 [Hondaea fermentalgiana]|eukprot:GBG30120.1 Hypothetical Protein FCC1311_063402 [Hondaea fermentalgiana]
MSMDAQDIAFEANPTRCPIQILQKTAFFNGSRLLVESQFHDSVDRIEHNEPMALELWLLPVLDQDADRHLRTARVDLGFRNALLAVSAEQSTWRYVFCKGLATNNEQAILPGTLERRASLRGTCPVVGQRRNCTPTLMLDSATGRLQVHLALASWTEERSPGGVLDFSTQTATESFRSTAQLRHGRWSHVALMLTGSHALLYINGQLDASYSARDTQRIAFNNYPLFFGSSPRATKEGSVAGEHGFVGFLHGVAMHTAVRDPTSFVNPDINRDAPPYPRPENEWGSILSSSIMTSNASIPGLGPDIQGQLQQARARQSLQRSWLDEQIREKAAQRESEEKRNEELAHEVLIQAQAWKEEQQARRAQNSRYIENISREMRTHMLEAMEQRRLTALQERLADVKLLGAFEDPSRIETARRQRVNNEYAQELRREADARQEARQQARDAELQAEKLRIQIQMESYRADQLQSHRRYLQKQERLRQELADQILDKACASQYSAVGNDKFMSAEERALNARVLSMLASVPKCQ